MLKGIHEMYPKINIEPDFSSDMIDECIEMKSEMSDIYDGRRIRF